jgi:NifB/MoaA-like Fe-S oxidoreductase
LTKSLYDMAALYPGIYSISVVPVGITKHREDLFHIKPFDKESSYKVIEQVSAIQNEFSIRFQKNVVYLADEFYINADVPIPDYKEYEDFPQIENGVGLLANFQWEFNSYFKRINKDLDKKIKRDKNHFEYNKVIKEHKRVVSIATGVSSYEFIKMHAKILEREFGNVNIKVYCIKNAFFGKYVTVTGLLTGSDLVAQLKGRELGEKLLLCRTMLKSDEDILLDDYSIERLENELEINIEVVDNNGKEFIKAILRNE